MVADVFERERSRMQLGPQSRAPQWGFARKTVPVISSKLPAIGFRTPGNQPASALHGAARVSSAASPASGALSGLARRYALPGVLRFGGGARTLYEWRLLMKVCSWLSSTASSMLCASPQARETG